MKKKDLKNGYIVTTRAGDKYMVCFDLDTGDFSGDVLLHARGWMRLDKYNDDLTCCYSQYDIIRVEKVRNPYDIIEGTCASSVETEVLWESPKYPKDYTMGEITRETAKSFYKDLCEKVYGDSNTTCGGIMCVNMIAEHMGISVERANEFCNEMIRDGITELQSGLIVV